MEPCRLIFFEEEHNSEGPNTPRDQQEQTGSQYTENQKIEESKVDMIFETQSDVIEYYTKFAKQEGFGVSKRTSTTGDYGEVKYFTIACNCHHKPISKSSKVDRPKPIGGTGCKAKINVKQIADARYQLSNVVIEHNDAVSPSMSRHIACHKKLSSWSKKRIEMMDKAGIRSAKNYKAILVEGGGYENLTFGEKECRNHINKICNKLLGEGDAEPFH
ncbi:putative protein FAR1-RELATED SEQUENCE 10 [Juglans regia]|uniref:FAR1 domain-containing protein n=2 Tax=Juglans regia TaxID=51240 RepID=A0A2I4EQD0_JUGRE|nr:putative protein FAR1-RELATED SEQUENCE 10 [Juglans regia]